jgi:hypothetical protein
MIFIEVSSYYTIRANVQYSTVQYSTVQYTGGLLTFQLTQVLDMLTADGLVVVVVVL